MIFPHIVICDGKWYPAGTDVPVGDTYDVAEEKQEEVVEAVVEEVAETPKKKITKTDLVHMKSSELREFANSVGYFDAEDVPVTELRKSLIKYLNIR